VHFPRPCSTPMHSAHRVSAGVFEIDPWTENISVFPLSLPSFLLFISPSPELFRTGHFCPPNCGVPEFSAIVRHRSAAGICLLSAATARLQDQDVRTFPPDKLPIFFVSFQRRTRSTHIFPFVILRRPERSCKTYSSRRLASDGTPFLPSACQAMASFSFFFFCVIVRSFGWLPFPRTASGFVELISSKARVFVVLFGVAAFYPPVLLALFVCKDVLHQFSPRFFPASGYPCPRSSFFLISPLPIAPFPRARPFFLWP